MPASPSAERQRLVLIAPVGADAERLRAGLEAAIAGGDVASLILPPDPAGEAALQRLAEAAVPLAQAAGIAVIVAGDTRVAGRVGADGVHLDGPAADLAEAVARYRGRMIVGSGDVKTRDEAMALGEAQPDYMFFGRFGMDTRPEPHRRNLDLAAWWSEMIEIPCIVMAGNSVESVVQAAATGAEFVALSSAVFADGVDAAAAVARANALLDGAAQEPA